MEGIRKTLPLTQGLQLGRFDLEVAVSSVLMFGVSLSILFILIGLLWQYIATGTFIANYILPKANFFIFSLDVLKRAFSSNYTPHLSIDLGIVVLMLTPYVRILASVIYFAAIEKNIKYTVFTMFVLSALSYSLFLR